MSVQGYKCPCCGGNLVFDSQLQKLRCPSCDSRFEMDTFREYAEIVEAAEKREDTYEWKTEEKAAEYRREEDGRIIYTCPSCGGEIEADATTAATACPYCDSPVILSQKVSGDVRPDIVIPFQIDKDKAKEAYREFCRKKKLLPKEFLSEQRMEELTGVYVPFWLFSCHAEGSINYDARQIKKWKDSTYEYTQTDYYLVSREGRVYFEHVPVDGSVTMDDAYMESIEPYDMTKAVPFEEGYLSGYSADKYDVSQEESRPRAEERIRRSFEEILDNSVDRKRYHIVTKKNQHIGCTDGTVKYGLLPVWTLQVKYKDQLYWFTMNGQTGKAAGELPVDQGIYWKTALKVFGVSTVVIYILLLLFAFI